MYFDFGNELIVDYDNNSFNKNTTYYGAVIRHKGRVIAQVFEDIGIVLVDSYDDYKNEDIIFDFTECYGNGKIFLKYVNMNGICMYAGHHNIFVPFNDERRVYIWHEKELNFIDLLKAKVYD